MVTVQITSPENVISPVLEKQIRKHIEKLELFFDRIISCRVVVKLQQNHKHQGKLYNVRIELGVPSKELVVTRHFHEDLYVAIRDSFNAMKRQLEGYTRILQGKVKKHNGVLHGHIVKLLPQEGYGFIAGIDGTEYYFSITNVTHPQFEHLHIGDPVEYIAEPLNEGWQAQHVVKERKHQPAA
jgi:ribosomal subunit interface protein